MAKSQEHTGGGRLKLRQHAARFVWTLVLYLSLAGVAVRIWFGSYPENPALGAPLKIMVVVLGYALFLLEGLLVAATQIRSADQEGVDAWIARHVPPHEKAKATQLAAIFRTKFEEFVSGRQIFVMFVVVGIAFVVDHLPIRLDSQIIGWANSIDIKIWREFRIRDVGTIVAKVFGGFYITFALVTLVPCWISQLLPQFLAERRSFEFIRFPLSGNSVRFSLFISRLGAGWPGYHFLGIFQGSGRFTQTEHYEIGLRSIFDKTSSTIGYHVEDRKITISSIPSGSEVRDTAIYLFVGGEHSSIQHTIRAGPNSARLEGWEVTPPSDIRVSEPEFKALSVTTSSIEEGMTTQLENNLVFASEISSAVPLPRPGKRDRISFTAKYLLDSLDLNPNSHTDIYLDTSQLTRKLTVAVETGNEAVLLKPSVQFVGIGDGKFLANAHPLPCPPLLMEAAANGWVFEVEYPPQNSICIVSLDARRTA